jgi:hypothetical protein
MLRDDFLCYGSHKKSPENYRQMSVGSCTILLITTKEVKMSNRTKGYTGTIVDGKKLAEIANGIYNLQYSSDFSECTVDNLLFIELEEKNVFGDPKYALVCSEGVGWEQDTYGCLEVPTNIGQMGLWNGRVFISVDTVKSCLTDKIEDISDYIRVFGSRLDSNCYLWQSKMSVVPATIAL